MDKLEALRTIPLFAKVDDDVLDPLLSYFVTKEYERDEFIWREGTDPHNFTFVVEGKVKISKSRPDGGEIILGVFGEGEAAGHIAVFREIPYPANATALDDTICLEIYRNHFLGTIQENPELMESLLESMMARNFHLVKRVQELSTQDAEQRVALLFEKFSLKVGHRKKLDDGSMGVFIDLPLSRRDIAELINVRVETAIRIMSRWNKEGPVRTTSDGFMVTDPEQLTELAEGLD